MSKHCLILVGGGARMFVQAGILREWLNHNPFPDVVFGVSSGAILGSFFSQGKLDVLMTKLQRLKKEGHVYHIRPLDAFGRKAAFLDPYPLKAFLDYNIKSGEFKIPCYGIITNWTKVCAESIYLNTLIDKASDWVMAAASPPVAFPPIRMNGSIYGDGGCIDDYPLELAAEMGCDIITIMTGVAQEPSKFNSVVDAISASAAIHDWTLANIERKMLYHFNQRDEESLTINFYGPTKPSGIGLLDFMKAGERAEELFDLGATIARNEPIQWLR